MVGMPAMLPMGTHGLRGPGSAPLRPLGPVPRSEGLRLPPLPFFLDAALPAHRPAADRARGRHVLSRGAEVAAEMDQLQVQLVPLLARERAHEIAFGAFDVRA